MPITVTTVSAIFWEVEAVPERVAGTDRVLPPGSLKLLLADKLLGWHALF